MINVSTNKSFPFYSDFKLNLKIKYMDIVVIFLCLLITSFVAYFVYSGKTTTSRIVVKDQNKTWIFPMSAEEELSISGPLGVTVISISKNKAAIISSPCPEQTCVASGHLQKGGQWAACLPNKVFLLIESVKNDGEVDAAAW